MTGRAGTAAVHLPPSVDSLGATVLLDRTDDPAEPLYVFADPAGHPFCIFVSPDHPG